VTLLYLVRHGNTFEAGEPPRRIGSRTDLPLTETGKAQGRLLGDHFAAIRFGHAWSADLRRSRETAILILAAQAEPPALSDQQFLNEIDHGPDENQYPDAVLRRIGAEALTAWERSLEPPPGWNLGLGWRRQGWQAAINKLAPDPSSDPVLAVTSSGAARLALLCLGVSNVPTDAKLRTGSYGVVSLGDDGRNEVLDWNVHPS
jgi:broad specificity phosphatase PhoE